MYSFKRQKYTYKEREYSIIPYSAYALPYLICLSLDSLINRPWENGECKLTRKCWKKGRRMGKWSGEGKRADHGYVTELHPTVDSWDFFPRGALRNGVKHIAWSYPPSEARDLAYLHGNSCHLCSFGGKTLWQTHPGLGSWNHDRAAHSRGTKGPPIGSATMSLESHSGGHLPLFILETEICGGFFASSRSKFSVTL